MTEYKAGKCDIAVIGAGHAGIVGIVLLDGQLKDVPALRRFAEGVEVAKNQVGRDPRLGAVLQPRIRRDDEVAVGRIFGQPVEASCGEYIACGHVTNSNFKI